MKKLSKAAWMLLMTVILFSCGGGGSSQEGGSSEIGGFESVSPKQDSIDPDNGNSGNVPGYNPDDGDTAGGPIWPGFSLCLIGPEPAQLQLKVTEVVNLYDTPLLSLKPGYLDLHQINPGKPVKIHTGSVHQYAPEDPNHPQTRVRFSLQSTEGQTFQSDGSTQILFGYTGPGSIKLTSESLNAANGLAFGQETTPQRFSFPAVYNDEFYPGFFDREFSCEGCGYEIFPRLTVLIAQVCNAPVYLEGSSEPVFVNSNPVYFYIFPTDAAEIL